ncbi:MAG: cation-translocating P-type ATPase [Bryobacterales bacterium]|nr:cation-translocating P-type ATPase [Bryobacterales bacterium]
MHQHTFQIQGMDCANESRVIDAALRACPGVEDVQFNLMRQCVTVHFDAARTGLSALRAAVQRAGFSLAHEDLPAGGCDGIRGQVHLASVSALLFLVGAMLSMGLVEIPLISSSQIPARFVLGISLLCSTRYFVPRGWQSLRHRHADMNVLVTVAALGAVLLGDWMEGALVTLLFAVAHLLEAASAARVRKSIERYLDRMPQSAERVVGHNGLTEIVPTHEVRAGDLLVVKPGARLPADGVVETGWSAVDQSALTGEVIPAEVQPGTSVYAGSTNGNGALRIRASRDAVHSLAARLEETIQRSQVLRSPTERWVERFARIYTPAVIALAAAIALLPPLIGYDWREWFYHSLVLLLIACPCALVISTPVTMVSVISSLARMGILVRGGDTVERAVSIRAVAFDKTGVLTTGNLRVRRLAAMPGVDECHALAYAAAVEVLSEHPAARAIVFRAQTHAELPVASQFDALPGMGGEGVVEGVSVWVGSPMLARQRGAWSQEADALTQGLSGEGGALVVAGSGDQLWLIAALADSPRPEASSAILELGAVGVPRIVMLSGDHPANCAAVARVVGISEVRTSLLPEEKLAALREIESASGPVLMVGDGINDAPAMAAASLSIAAGQRASEVTLQAADAVIWDGDLRRVPLLLAQSQRAMRVVRQNVLLAVGSKALFAILALLGLATLWMAVVADVGATILVTANGLRLLRTRHGKEIETNSGVVAPSTSW